MLTVAVQLKRAEVKEKYKTIVIDTIEDLVFYAGEYVLQTNNASKPTDLNYGGYYVQLEQMFRKLFKDIVRNYGLIVIGHADTKQDEDDKDIMYATLRLNKKVKGIVMGLLDQLIYIEGDRANPGRSIAHYQSSVHWEAKTRFPNIKKSNIFSYQNIVTDIHESLKNIATVDSHKQYIKDEKIYTQEEFEQLQNQANLHGKQLVESHGLNTVVSLINSILGKRIQETDVGDSAALNVLLQEFEILLKE